MTTKGHIWLFARSLPAHVQGGMEQVAYNTCAGLAERGWRIDLITNRLPADPGLPESVEVHALAAAPGVYSRAFSREIIAWTDAQPTAPDLVFSVSSAANPIVRGKPDLPSILQCHGTAWSEALSKFLVHDPRGLARSWFHLTEERPTLGVYDRIVAVGPAVQEYLTSFPYRFIPPQQIVMIPNGVNLGDIKEKLALNRNEIRRRLAIADDQRVILSASRLTRQKGVLQLLKAYAASPNRERSSIIIAGAGPDERALRSFCRRRNLSQVAFLGPLSNQEVLEAIRASDLVALVGVGKEAGLPLIAMESLSMGCPILQSRSFALFGMNRENGVIRVDPRDVNAIAEGLEAGLRMGGHLPELAAAAQRAFSLDRMIDRYEEIIEAVLSEPRRRR